MSSLEHNKSTLIDVSNFAHKNKGRELLLDPERVYKEIKY